MQLVKVRKIFTKDLLIVIVIVVLAFFLRFWNLSELLIFTLDEEVEAFMVKNIVTGYHFPAIGVAVAPIGIHLSPVFYYLAAIPFGLGNLHPIAWGITSSLLGVITTIIFYLTCKEMFSKNIAQVAALLYATSFLMVMYDKHFWNVTPIPIISIISLYSLYKIISGNIKWVVVLSLCLAIGISSHLSSLVLVFLSLVIWFLYRLPIFNKYVAIAIAILFFSQLPLIIFELRHNFLQSQSLVNFVSGGNNDINITRVKQNLELLPKVFSRLLYIFGSHDFAKEHTYSIWVIAQRDARIPSWILNVVFAILLLGGYISIKNWSNVAFKINALLILSTLFLLIIYGFLFTGSIFEFYLAIIFPSLMILVSICFNWIISKYRYIKPVLVCLLAFLVILNIIALLNSSHTYGLKNKLAVIDWAKTKIGNQEYELHSIGYDHKYEGYRYLFERFFKPPIRSYADPQLSWIFQSDVINKHPEIILVLASTEPHNKQAIEKELAMYEVGKIEEFRIGDIHAMIVNSNKVQFDE